MGLPALISGIASRMLPLPVGDGENPIRLNRYREQIVVPTHVKMHALADEGCYFVAASPTPGTGLAAGTDATFVDTVPTLYLYNTEQQGPNAKSVFLDYMKWVVTVSVTSGTTARLVARLDPGERNLSTDNTTGITPVSPNSALGIKSVLRVQHQSSGTNSALGAASKNVRNVVNASFGGLLVVGDEIGVVFGATDIGAYNGLTAAQATNPGRKMSNAAPVVIGPNTNLAVHLFFAGAAAGLSAEFEMGYWER